MQNLPNIGPTEVAVVSVAAVVLCFAPTVLAWTETRRRRRAERLALQAAAGAGLPLAAPPEVAFGELPESPGLPGDVPLPEAGSTAAAESGLPGVDLPQPVPSAVLPQAEATSPEPVAPVAPVETRVPALEPLVVPFDTVSGHEEPGDHHFRLEDLRQVRLPDWPPAAVRNDPERWRLWQEAQHLSAQAVVTSAALASPFPVQSSCLGNAEAEGSRLRIQFLLFPDLWPVSPTQAVAAAVFEVDAASGEIRSWVARVK